MIELNLLPDVKKEFISAQRTRNSVISGAILVTIAAGVVTLLLALTVYGGQVGFMKLQTETIKKKATELSEKPEIEKYLTVQNQLENIDALHSGKSIYSRAFAYLQSLNPAAPNNVALSLLEVVRDDTTIEVSGSVKNFESLSVFKTTLESASLKYSDPASPEPQSTQLFSAVNLKEASLKSVDGESVVIFTIELTYNAVIFAPTTKANQLIIPNESLSDADRNAPQNLFGSNPEETQ